MKKRNVEKEQAVNIVFVADKGYLLPTSVAIASLAENKVKDSIYNVYIVTVEKDATEFNKIEKYYKDTADLNIIIITADESDIKGLHRFEDNTYLSATETSLLKFKLPELLPNLNKVIFLDGDILVKGDLTGLYDTELNGKTIAAVRDLPQVIYELQEIGAEINGSDYFNSGVMVLDLERMRRTGKTSELIETKRNLKDSTLMDQNVFNIVFKDDVCQLHVKYNVCYINLIYSVTKYDISRINSLYGTTYESPYDIEKDCMIIHYSSKTKPWLFYDVPLADEWLFYYKKSPFKNEGLYRTWHKDRDVDKKAVKKEMEKIEKTVTEGKNKKRGVVPIVFAADGEYFLYTAAAIRSVIECSSADRYYDINVLVDESVPEHMTSLLEKSSSGNVSIKTWDVRNCFEGDDLYSVGHFSKQMYYRWLIPEIFNYYDKVLYLDCDVAVTKDLSELYDIDIGDYVIAAVQNYVRSHLEGFITEKLGLSTDQYYNSGVMLINNKKFAQDRLKHKCISFLKENEKLACPDQDVLNVVCKGKILKLPDEWNFQWHHRFEDIVSGELLPEHEERYKKQEKKQPYIIHFTSQVKPWNDPDRKYSDIFWRHCRNTCFYENVLIRQFKKGLKKVEAEKEEIIRDSKRKDCENANRIKGMQKGMDDLHYIISETRKSKTYKIGLAITAIPRYLREMIGKV